jgi:hypothetical protein
VGQPQSPRFTELIANADDALGEARHILQNTPKSSLVFYKDFGTILQTHF